MGALWVRTGHGRGSNRRRKRIASCRWQYLSSSHPEFRSSCSPLHRVMVMCMWRYLVKSRAGSCPGLQATPYYGAHAPQPSPKDQLRTLEPQAHALWLLTAQKTPFHPPVRPFFSLGKNHPVRNSPSGHPTAVAESLSAVGTGGGSNISRRPITRDAYVARKKKQDTT